MDQLQPQPFSIRVLPMQAQGVRVRAIVMAARAAQSNGGALGLDSRLPDQARRVIEITGLQSVIQVE